MKRSRFNLTVGSRVFAVFLSLAFSTLGLATDSDHDGIEDAKDTYPMIPQYHVSLGQGHSCALDDYGLQCWGRNAFGQAEVPSGDLVFIQADAPGAETTVEPSVTASTALLAQVNHSVEMSESTYLTMTDKVDTDSIKLDFTTFLKRLIGDLGLGF